MLTLLGNNAENKGIVSHITNIIIDITYIAYITYIIISYQIRNFYMLISINLNI